MSTESEASAPEDEDGQTFIRTGGPVPVQAPAEDLPDDLELSEGLEVGEYVIDQKIGAGAFGDVYAGHHPLIGKKAAIKVLAPKYSVDAAMVSRFIAEARAVNQIRHQNIIDIFSFGQLPDGRRYYVMEYLDGAPLDEFVEARGGRLPLSELLPVLWQLARALDAAHSTGIAHRDLKPANVFLSTDYEGELFPKLLDFGIAKLIGEESQTGHQTATGMAMGTPNFMSPEQCEGKTVDHRTDIYAFGVMTYNLLVGDLPFSGNSAVELMMAHITQAPKPPSEACPELPPEIDAPILHMMAKAPEDRPDNLTLAMDALERAALAGGQVAQLRPRTSSVVQVVGGQAPAGQAGIATESAARAVGADAGSGPARRKALGIGIAVAVLAVVGAGGWFLTQSSQKASPAPAAAAPFEKPAPQAVPAAPTQITLRIAGSPENMVATSPSGEVLASGLGEIKMSAGDRPRLILFSAPGHETLRKTITPDQDQSIEVTLSALAPAPAAKKPAKKKRSTRRSRRRAKAKPKARALDDVAEPEW